MSRYSETDFVGCQSPRPLFFGDSWYLSYMKELEKALDRIYNRFGNKYLTDNFDTEPFEFKVKIRRGNREEDLHNYIIEIYSVPDMPDSFDYKGGKRDGNDGIDISVFKYKLKELMGYIDTSFGEFRKTVGIRFMNAK